MNWFKSKNLNDELSLIKALKAGNISAQRQLYDQMSRKMLAVCKHYISDLHYAEDCMINGFCKVYLQIHQFDAKGSFEGWVRRIMVNECLTFLRKKQTMIYVEDYREVNNKQIDQELESLDLDFNVEEVLSKLPETYRLVFNLHVLEDYSHQEIAEALNISVASSKTQLFRAKVKLKEIILSYKTLQNEI